LFHVKEPKIRFAFPTHSPEYCAQAASTGGLLCEQSGGMMKGLIAAILLCASATAASAIDMKSLAPCKPAAAKFCDKSKGMTMANLLQCGAILAGLSDRVGNQCRQVLRRYGQL
jgi:hypothetical protein